MSTTRFQSASDFEPYGVAAVVDVKVLKRRTADAVDWRDAGLLINTGLAVCVADRGLGVFQRF
jgi:hypothetical protein